ncbi:hypothetical protein RIF29_16182 [Crotalaria pallida]|uniref:Protein kinase domain-containing protein n=1 Tax=Crotalaria pallida TaxID=3830 RepID=A0AAN9FFY3_CROPI
MHQAHAARPHGALHLRGESRREQRVVEPRGEGEIKRGFEERQVVRIGAADERRGVHELDAGDILDAEIVDGHDLVAGAGGDAEDLGVVAEEAVVDERGEEEGEGVEGLVPEARGPEAVVLFGGCSLRLRKLLKVTIGEKGFKCSKDLKFGIRFEAQWSVRVKVCKSLIRAFMDHSNFVNCVRYSPDGVHTGSIYAVSCNPDGKHDLATAGARKRPTYCVLVMTKPTKSDLEQGEQEKLKLPPELGNLRYLQELRLDRNRLQGSVADLARLSHENTGKLLGYCRESTPFTRMLVFEYASNGTLYDHLHCYEEGCQFSWTRRMKIVIGIARGLKYLHTEIEPPFTISELHQSQLLMRMIWVELVLVEFVLSGYKRFG